ncbi:40S ribosomal protein S0 [Mycena chlorophos]|uniref:40S ribosomal protein S0 n=1 Tax=Mycena chlorophos TaxID=658473 RepID=A0A8H6WL33_MYCCL|nr:40S ribosomal protein S0 [Mycena chlorophos]
MIKFLPRARLGGELATLAHLNSPEVMKDGHNYSVPVVDYLKFGDGTFIVMQRWGKAIAPDLATVGDYVCFGRGALEALAFFHKHGITHGDLWEANLLMDVAIANTSITSRLAGVSGPHRRFALIDFETSRVGATGEDGEKRRVKDVVAMGRLLEGRLRCLTIDGFVPGMSAWVDKLLDAGEHPLTAAEALRRYNELCAPLSGEVLNTVMKAQAWRDGRSIEGNRMLLNSRLRVLEKHVTALNMLRTTTVGVTVSVVTFSLFKWRPIRPIVMDSFSSTVYWTCRAWLWGIPGRLSETEFWAFDSGPPQNDGTPPKDRARWVKYWRFVAPFLASKGYFLFSVVQPEDLWMPELERSRPGVPPSEQFVETIYRDDEDARYRYAAARVWPAQDAQGRDVMIKFLPRARLGGELATLAHLNSPDVMKDGHNYSVPVVEHLKFGDGTFVVMQRWGEATDPDLATVGDYVRFGRGALEALAFFHKHDVTHGDIWESNLLIDVAIASTSILSRLAGVSGPHRRYALIDFETARVGVVGEEGAKRRLKDVVATGSFLGPYLRCLAIEGYVPQMDSWVDRLEESNENLPTAAEALQRYNEICAPLSEAALNTVMKAQAFRRGKVQYRMKPPMYELPPRGSVKEA